MTQPTVFPGNKKMYYPPEYAKVAQSIGKPSRKNCGTCHFYGGGGDGVKHGDLDSSLIKPNKELDVHMGVDGQNFDCVRCHTTTLHKVAGRLYTQPAFESRKSLVEDDLTSKITCESCHTAKPHKNSAKVNDHTDKVACQSCHIPTFARVNPTKMSWDWSTAGKKKNGKPYKIKDSFGKDAYFTKKGDMHWEKNVEPDYFWFNGAMEYMTVKDVIDPAKVVELNRPLGRMRDANSRIFPFKIHRGKQPYDKVNKTMSIVQLFPKGKDDATAYWKKYDWAKAIGFGMNYVGLPFSGEYDFVETSYMFPITHMVAPKEKALDCSECHTRKNGRMAHLAGFYMPGRDHAGPVDTLGWLIVLASLIGVVIHGLGRFVSALKKGEE